MKRQPIFEWNEESGVASCILTNGQKCYVGTAQCHSEDEDMQSEKTGCEIAFKRARIKVWQGYRDELKIKFAALNQLYYSMKHSSHFNEKSYENKMLQRQINLIKFDLDTIKEMIDYERKELRDYIKNKDIFYNKVRERRHNNERLF